jgi:hypothetical protein
MKLLINDREIVEYLIPLVDLQNVAKDIQISEENISEVKSWINFLKDHPKKFEKVKPKIKGKIIQAVEKDLTNYVNSVKEALKNKKERHSFIVKKKLNQIVDSIGEDTILKNYKKSNIENYVKTIGKIIDPSATLIRRHKFTNLKEDCLLRNTSGNENLLVNKIDNNFPFWFIDSGYTNFLGKNKVWHRLVRNHLHFGRQFNAPVDRLGMFETFPQQWRNSGDKILVIEPGEFAAAIFHVDIKQWKYSVESQLRQYTDKKIVFREKAPKKQRLLLHKHLLDEDYYCLININSNAATESIWAGIPVITLDRHVTNSVSKNSLSDINNLYRGSLADWLCMLSYSQFTFNELSNGTAMSIIKKYHE